MPSINPLIVRLHATLDRRPTPEYVCSLILPLLAGRLLPAQQRVLDRHAQSRPGRYSSMSDDFDRPPPMDHKARVLEKVLAGDTGGMPYAVTEIADDPELMGHLLRVLSLARTGREVGEARLTRAQRDAAGLGGLSRRRYNRLARTLDRAYGRALRLREQQALRRLTLVSRSGLGHTITLDEVRDLDPAVLCFVAYYVANRNRRRAFTTSSRDNPFDAIAEMLLGLCPPGDVAAAQVIARARPAADVLRALPPAALGELLGRWSALMVDAASRLQVLHDGFPAPFSRATMVVRAGMDSSTWNTVAGAYNAARDGWINTLDACGGLGMLDVACPGKAMRLMAADLVYGLHGGDVDPQTRVWAELPAPWQVLHGGTPCSRNQVAAACRRHGVDMWHGWIGPRTLSVVAPVTPTPELVHGIAVHDPIWAGLLRRAGAFSGKPVDPAVLGAATTAS